MLAKYAVEFTISFRRHQITHHYRTDDPVALEEFIVELLEKVLREGIPLPQHEADKIVQNRCHTAGGQTPAALLGN
jgi:hypothetical protein